MKLYRTAKPPVMGTFILSGALLIWPGLAAPLAFLQSVTPESIAGRVSGKNTVDSLELRGRVVSGVDARTGLPLPESAAAALSIKLRTPDAYLRVHDDRYSTQKNGYIGSVPLFGVVYKAGSSGSAGIDQVAYVPEQRAAAARLALGVLGVFVGPLRLSAERQGASSTFRVTGPDGFDCFVDVLGETGLPQKVRYGKSVFFYTPPASGEAIAARRMEKSEVVMTFADRRRVEGVLVPYSILTTARSLVTGESLKIEEIKVSEVRINPPLTATDFSKQP